MRCRELLLVSILLSLGGCAATGGSGFETGPPPPFSAEAIREANPPGTRLRFRLEQGGGGPVVNEMLFVTGNQTETTIRSQAIDDDGGTEKTSEAVAAWTELRDHAAFPPDKTRRQRSRCTVAAGRFKTWLYLVDGAKPDGTPTISRYQFAIDRPGPPVLLEVEENGEIGLRMELIEDTRGR